MKRILTMLIGWTVFFWVAVGLASAHWDLPPWPQAYDERGNYIAPDIDPAFAVPAPPPGFWNQPRVRLDPYPESRTIWVMPTGPSRRGYGGGFMRESGGQTVVIPFE